MVRRPRGNILRRPLEALAWLLAGACVILGVLAASAIVALIIMLIYKSII